MKLQITLALICVLFPKALALRCYLCTPDGSGTCTTTETDCPDQCGSGTSLTSAEGQQQEFNFKECATAENCVSGSLNLGFVKTTTSTKCCNTDLCNNQKVPALSFGSPNGRSCYTCVNSNCTIPLNCEGDEDRCITVHVTDSGTPVTMKGCVSKSLCTASRSSVWGKKEPRIPEMSCCEGDLCNSAAGVKLSLLIMLVPLLSSFFL